MRRTLRQFRGSLRLRASLLVVAVVAALWLLAAGLTWRAAEHEAAEIFDGHLAQAASMLLAQTAIEIEEPEAAESDHHAPLTHRYARKVAFQIWEHGKELLVHSHNAPSTRLGSLEEGFSDSRIDGTSWRVFSAWNTERKLLLQVGERAEARQDMADELAFGLLRPLLWALPILAILVWWAVVQALRPMSVLSEELNSRSPDRLDPLQVEGLPSELEPLVDRLNVLLHRVQSALGAEKRFTGDAAHELRTPIAALSAQAQVALAEVDPLLKEKALQAVLLAAGRMSRLVEQLLTLARVDSALPKHWPEIDISELVREVLADLAPAALAREVDLALESPGPLVIHGERAWLGIALRNLLDNAVRHSPPGGTVQVFLQNSGTEIDLVIIDQGAGVPVSQCGHLGERFWRAEGDSGVAGGCGLGLSIVRRIAELHAAKLSFSSEKREGLRVGLSFLPSR